MDLLSWQVDAMSTHASPSTTLPAETRTPAVAAPAKRAVATGESVETAAPLLLVVDDDDDARELTARILRRAGLRCVEASSGDAALAFVDACPEPIDAMVLDVMMPGMSGFEVLRRLRGRPGGVGIPVILVTASATHTIDVLHGFAGGAIDYITKPYDAPVLAARVRACCERGRATRRLRAALVLAERQAATDPLTGLFNRRHLGGRIAEALAHSRRHGEPFTLVQFDVDHLKEVNDIHGHEAGDRVLVRFATLLREVLRGEDAAFRIGGDEFVALLRACDTDRAMAVVERLHAHIVVTATEGEPDLRFSAGIAGSGATPQETLRDVTPERLLARADAALYQAKRSGRDCVEVFRVEERKGARP